MDDRHLSRGKTIYGPRPHFVTGHYVSVPRPMIVSTKTRIGGGWDADDVDPATIGRCTGLRDVNGTLIFEGDVIYIDEWKEQYPVVWHWYGWYLNTPDNYEPLDEIEAIIDFEVIGNVHDNPDLLGVSGNG